MYKSVNIHKNIEQARLYRNYSQDYLAYKLGISQNGYSKLERGQTGLSVEKLMVIADALEIDLMKLIAGPDINADLAAIASIPVVPQLLEIICRNTGMGFAAIARVTEDRWVCCSLLDKIAFGMKPGDDLKIETTICNKIRETREAVAIDSVSEDAVFANDPIPAMYGFQSYISVPILRRDGSLFGTLCAIDPKPAKINTPETIGLFGLFAQLISFHLDAIEQSALTVEKHLDVEQKRLLQQKLSAILGEELPTPLRTILEVSTQKVAG